MIHKNWQDLIKPRGLEVTPGRDPKKMATAVAEPLERGFGLTLGNALRRVLLSSLQARLAGGGWRLPAGRRLDLRQGAPDI